MEDGLQIDALSYLVEFRPNGSPTELPVGFSSVSRPTHTHRPPGAAAL
jgi:hypothetical protein